MTEILDATSAKPAAQPVSETIGIFYGQLSGLLKAGMPLPHALRTLASEADSTQFREALSRAADAIEDGRSPADAFAAEEQALGGLLGRVTGAAAASGTLPQMLTELSGWTLTQERIHRRISDALTYPAVVLFLASVLCFVMFAFIDRGDWSQFYADMEMQPPAEAGVLRVLRIIFYFGLLALILGLPAISFLSRSRGGVRALRDTFFIYAPAIGSVYRPLALSRFCGSIAVLLKAGTPYHLAVAAAGKLTGFKPYADAGSEAAKLIEAGQDSSEAWSHSRLFPPSLRFVLASATIRGDLPEAFSELGKLYQIEAEGRGRLVALLAPPACLILVGAIVSVFIYSILSPLIHIMQMIGR
ncbi:MAG TPA: type II secretion system F family protein [Planctomycetota bacterium]|nr:type II secretion system F family protein [Planctomycetota bacterium]